MNDALGLAVGSLLGGGQGRIVSGGQLNPGGHLVFENVQGIGGWLVKEALGGGNPNAVTFGNVIVTSEKFDLTNQSGAEWLAHESAHTRQAESMGVGYLPSYLYMWICTGFNKYRIPAEIEAGRYAKANWQDYLDQGAP